MRISEEQKFEILAGLDFGATDKEIAQTTGVSESHVHKVRTSAGVPPVRQFTMYERLQGEVVAAFKTQWKPDVHEVAELFEGDLRPPQIIDVAKIAGIRTDNKISKQERRDIARLLKADTPLREISQRFNALSFKAILAVYKAEDRRRCDIQRRWDARKKNRRDERVIVALKSGRSIDEVVAEFKGAKQEICAVNRKMVRAIAKKNDIQIPVVGWNATKPEKVQAVIKCLEKKPPSWDYVVRECGVSVSTVREIAAKNKLTVVPILSPEESLKVEKRKAVIAALHALAVKHEMPVTELYGIATTEASRLKRAADKALRDAASAKDSAKWRAEWDAKWGRPDSKQTISPGLSMRSG